MRLRLLLLVLTTTTLASACANTDAETLRAQLEHEFDGAYPPTPASGGKTHEIELIAAPASMQITEGTMTDVWAYNGTVPGPSLQSMLGDTMQVTVHNRLPAATTIHWHGIRVPNNMDGVPGINQTQIEPGESFIYEFTPPDAGTFWYHSHTDGSQQLERGLYGSIVVKDIDEARNYSTEEVWVIDDWLLDENGQINPAFNTTSDRTHSGRWGNLITVNASPTETLTTGPGELVRLRMVNASNGRVYSPDFGTIDATVIAIDGLNVKAPFDATGLILAPGNRADVVINTPELPGTYVVNDIFVGTAQPLASIVVVADTSDEAADHPESNDAEPSATADLEPLANLALPDWKAAINAPVDQDLLFETSFVNDEWRWTINGAAFPDYEPIKLTEGRFTKMRLVSLTHPLHPIHLHGQFFKVLTRNGVPVDEPFFRDTVLLEMLDEVEIGLVPLDTGKWVLHCHIQEHAEAGMMTVVNVEPAS